MMTAMLTVENIDAGSRIYNIWNVNEDAEYHESGDEGESAVLDTVKAQAGAGLSEGQAAALQSERDVPQRIAQNGKPETKVNKAA